MVDVEITELLRHAMGLDADSIGQATVNHAVNRRLRALNLSDRLPEYMALLRTSPKELTELVEEVAVHETWFLRDRTPFRALTDQVRGWRQLHPGALLKIMSIPCSTGEEPYSIAISLLEAGWSANELHIDAIDISGRSLAQAQKALYGKNSFRGNDLGFRASYFTGTPEGYLLNPNIRANVSFFKGNLLNSQFMAQFSQYDIIFCRNLLIYLDTSSQQRAIATLDRLLVADGLLFSGHAEPGMFSQSQFQQTDHRQAFCFRKKPKNQGSTSRSTPLPPWPWAVPPPPAPGPPGAERVSWPLPATPTVPSILHRLDPLKEARDLADQGRFGEAIKSCEEHHRLQGPTAAGFFLLGEIYNAQEKTEKAINRLRKAIYLQPDHREALILLSLIFERLGDQKNAESVKRRLLKVRERRAGVEV